MCGGSWGSITARGGSSGVGEKVSWQCNQSRAEWINRRATQIDAPSCPVHPPAALMLPQDTFSLPVMSPWQPINKHFQVVLTQQLSYKWHQVRTMTVVCVEPLRTKDILYHSKEKRYGCMRTCDDVSHHGRVDGEAGWHTVEEEEQDTASPARNLYLSSMLSTWPCRLHCAYLGFHPPGIPQPDFTKLLQSAERLELTHIKAVYLQCSTELYSAAASFVKSDVFVGSWPDLDSRFELGPIGASWKVGWANWGNVRLINM